MHHRDVRIAASLLLALSLLTCASCTGDKGGTPKQVAGPPKTGASRPDAQDDAHGHSHERGKMKLADAGPYHALLTAHLSAKDGNELDVFFETQDEEAPQPVAIPLKSFAGQARTEAGDLKELMFECAPAMEQPKGEKAGTCSHFVAKVPWMKATDQLYVQAKIKLVGKERTVRWKDFNPKKFAHHED